MEGDQKNEDVRLKEKPFILFPMRKGFQEDPVLEEIVSTGEITQGYS